MDDVLRNTCLDLSKMLGCDAPPYFFGTIPSDNKVVEHLIHELCHAALLGMGLIDPEGELRTNLSNNVGDWIKRLDGISKKPRHKWADQHEMCVLAVELVACQLLDFPLDPLELHRFAMEQSIDSQYITITSRLPWARRLAQQVVSFIVETAYLTAEAERVVNA